MGLSPPKTKLVRFGLFEADLEQRLLTKGGFRVKLQGQPFRVLALLLERRGEVVTRDEIRQKLWPANTHVEFDDGLNTAIKKLRAALCDVADNPRFIETVPRQGYRFVASVTYPPPVAPSDPPQSLPSVRPEIPTTEVVIAAREQSRRVIEGTSPPWRSHWFLVAACVVLVIGAGFMAILSHRSGNTRKKQEAVTVVLADFINTTGDLVFNDALKQALVVELEQSPTVKILSDRKVATTERLMNLAPGGALTPAIAQEVCQRTGSDAVVKGSIASLGEKYLLALSAMSCASGDAIADEQAQASKKEDVVAALGQVALPLRSRLGESLGSVQKYQVPLEQATTPSLEALQAYGIALKVWDDKGDGPSVPFFRRAIELDPNFAMAYAALGTIFHNRGDDAVAGANIAKAYELRNRVAEHERFSIEARYYRYVTGELEEAAQVYEMFNQAYPGAASGHANLGTIHMSLGHYQKAEEEYRESVRLDATRSINYGDLVMAVMALNHFDQAEHMLVEANQRNLQSENLLEASYYLAFLRGNSAQMEKSLEVASARPDVEALMLAVQSATDAYHGMIARARERIHRATQTALKDGDRQAAAAYLAQTALWEADLGSTTWAKQDVGDALALAPAPAVQAVAALALARAGEVKKSQSLASTLRRNHPADTLIQGYWMPTISAASALGEGHAVNALKSLELAGPFELGQPPPYEIGPMCPVYLRGEAYLMSNHPAKAVEQYEEILAHRGIVLNSPVGALAQLGLARSYAALGDRERSRASYNQFFALWKNADPEASILREAQQEYSKL